MAASKLIGMLGELGGGTLVGQIAKGVGGPIISSIAERYGLDQNDPKFDETAADRLAADQEANQFVKDMEAMHLEKFKVRVGDAQHARTATMSAREKMSLEHQQKIDMINLFESVFMSVGGLVFLIGSVGALVWFESKTPSEDAIPDWLQSVIIFLLGWISKDLISLRAQFKFGSTEGSSKKNNIISEVLEREQEQDEMEIKQQPRIVETVSTTRPMHSPAQAAPQPVAPAPAPEMDEIDAAMAATVSTTRPGSNGDNIL